MYAKNQILVHFANTFAPYRNWVFTNGYRKGELHLTPDTAANTVLPDRDHINLQAFGDPDPPRHVWDDYNTYRGAQPKGKAKAKASVFTQNIEPPSEPEHSTALGVDPSLNRVKILLKKPTLHHRVGRRRRRLDQRNSLSPHRSQKSQIIHRRGLRAFDLQAIKLDQRSLSR